MERISYVKVLIEVGISQLLMEKVEIVTPMGSLVKPIDYDWWLSYCSSCLKFGHWKEDYWHNIDAKKEKENSKRF